MNEGVSDRTDVGSLGRAAPADVHETRVVSGFDEVLDCPPRSGDLGHFHRRKLVTERAYRV